MEAPAAAEISAVTSYAPMAGTFYRTPPGRESVHRSGPKVNGRCTCASLASGENDEPDEGTCAARSALIRVESVNR